METLTFENSNGVEISEPVYNIDDFFPILEKYDVVASRGRNAAMYYNIASTFDIESTTISNKPLSSSYSFMYHWQFCLHDKVVFGRTWQEFIDFLIRLRKELRLCSQRKLIIFAHNLQFEWQFMSQFIYERFDKNIECFYIAKRRPLSIRLDDSGIEFRCSWKLSNMSLAKYVKNAGSKYLKMSGDDYNYNIIRTPSTPLTNYEKAYCFCDVRGLCDAIEKEFDNGFNITTLPLTSTGFVRKDTLNAFRNYDKYINTGKCTKRWQEIFDNIPHQPPIRYSNFNNDMKRINHSADLYMQEKNASRGGDTHGNILFIGDTMYGVYSHDRKSSYPAVQLTYKYPTGHWASRNVSDDRVFSFCTRQDTAVIFTIVLKNIKLKRGMRCPYIMRHKCKSIKNGRFDNGRVFIADGIVMTVTEVDWLIIERQYDFDVVTTIDVYTCGKDYLPVPLRAVNLLYFYNKCKLDGVDDYMYMKSKNKLNGIFGMTFTDVVHDLIEYNLESREWTKEKASVQESLDKYYSAYNSCLHYDTGIYTTAYARKELHDAIFAVGDSFIYGDTDSVKWTSKSEDEINRILKWFETKNKELTDIAHEHGAFYKMPNGNEIVLGVWENESKDGNALYEKFKTYGAKKYAYHYTKANHNGEFGITVAGLNKTKGAEYINNIENFYLGLSIPGKFSGRMTAVCNDDPIHTIVVNGEEIETASNIAMIDTTYNLGLTFDFMELVAEGEILFQ